MNDIAEKLIIVGGSAGAFDVILKMISNIPKDFEYAVVIVLHRNAKFVSKLEESLADKFNINIMLAEDKEYILKNRIYFASAGYHLLFEPSKVFALDISEPVSFSRPSIDVSFESAAEVYKENLTLVLLSGANSDGANGLVYAHRLGAHCYVQRPQDAEVAVMPFAGIEKLPEVPQLSNTQLTNFFNKFYV